VSERGKKGYERGKEGKGKEGRERGKEEKGRER